jgi:hypothetical protein
MFKVYVIVGYKLPSTFDKGVGSQAGQGRKWKVREIGRDTNLEK